MMDSKNYPRKKMLTWGLAGGVIVVLLMLAFRQPPLAVEQARVIQGNLRVTLYEEGETRVRQRFLVSAPAPGRLQRIELEPGDPVVAGETVLATFEPQPSALLDPRRRAGAAARVQAAEATMRQAKAATSRAEAE